MSQKTIVIILSLMLLGVGSLPIFFPPEQQAPPELQGILWPQPKPLQAITLIDQHQQPFKLERLKNKWTFLFFGYTYCPDICPTAMVVLKTVYERLKSNPKIASDTQVIFVSVDPQRDTFQKLSDYVTFFNEDFMGITGTTEEIDQLTHQLSASYIKQPVDALGNYQITHPSTFFLIDPQARLFATFSLPHVHETIVSQYLKIRSL